MELKIGSITLIMPDHIQIPAEAGKKSQEEIAKMPRARRGVGLVAESVANAMRNSPDRLSVPGIQPDQLAAAGRAAEDIDQVIADTEAALIVLKQANLLLDAGVHRQLAKSISYVRVAEKYDPQVASLVPTLVEYWANSRPDKDEGEEEAEK